MREVKTKANLKNRIGAALLDYLIYFTCVIGFMLTFGEPDSEGTFVVTGLKMLFPFIFWFVYFPVMESAYGQTLGKRVTGTRVVSINGQPLSLGKASIRRLLDTVDLSLWGLVGILVIKNTEKHQRVGDLVANTIVVGGEIVYCEHCLEKVKLEPADTIKGAFDCPHCEKPSEAIL